MNIYKYKLIAFLLFFMLIVGGAGLYLSIQKGRNKDSFSPYRLVPLNSQVLVELHTPKDLQPFYKDFYSSEECFSASSLVENVLDVFSREVDFEDPLIFICDSLNSLDGETFIIPYKKHYKKRIASYLKETSAQFTSPKVFTYRDVEMLIYPLKNGGFLTSTLLDSYFIVSTKKSKVEEVIDSFIDGRSLLDSNFSQYYQPLKDSRISAIVYLNSKRLLYGRGENTSEWLDQEWVRYNLWVTEDRLLVAADLNLELKDDLFLQERDIKDTLSLLLPNETFAYYHWTLGQFNQICQASKQDTILSIKELEWNDKFCLFMKDMARRGLDGMRVQDTVVSSEVLLRIPLHNVDSVQAKMDLLQRENRWLIRSLLREEGLYNHFGAIALPSPWCLNLLTESSRDLRVVYLAIENMELLMSWDYTLLNKYITKRKHHVDDLSHIALNYSVLHSDHPLFYANMSVLKNDTLSNYNELPTYLLNKAESLSNYSILREFTKLDESVFITTTFTPLN